MRTVLRIVSGSAEAGGVASGTEAYYSFDYANVHFIVLDSHDSPRSPGGAMLTWMKADLAATFAGKTIGKGEGSLGQAWATGLPVIAPDLTSDRCCAARAAAKAGLKQTVVLPVMRDGAFSAAIAWYP